MKRLVLLALALVPQGADDLPRRRDTLSARVEVIRGRRFETPVPIDVGTRKEGGTVALEQSRDLYGGDLKGFERVLKALGLIPGAVKLDLAIPSFAAAAMKAYVAGGTLKVLDPAISDDELIYRLALVMSERAIAASASTYDARLARLAVRHGDADMTKQLYWAGMSVNDNRPDTDHVKKLVESAEKWERETSRFASLVAPRFLVRSSDFMWRRGGIFMETLREEGGAARLREVYTRPPESTEQVLHPEKYIAGEKPATLDLKPLDDLMASRGAAPVFRTTLGELGAALLLESLQEKPGAAAAAGWAGDTFLSWADGAKVLVAWATAWDEVKEAREFEDAAAAAAFALNGRDEEAKAFVVRRGRSVALVLNAPETLKASLLEALWKGTRTSGAEVEPYGRD